MKNDVIDANVETRLHTLTKVYAAFYASSTASNIFETYYAFFASIILEEQWVNIDPLHVRENFTKKYDIDISQQFVNQVLNIGVENKSIIKERGKYIANYDVLSQYEIDTNDYEMKWKKLLSDFLLFCRKENYTIDESSLEDRILDFLDENDSSVLNFELTIFRKKDIFVIAWSRFLQTIRINDSGLFDFVAMLSYSNIMRQAIFYDVKENQTFNNLSVYLDTPLVISLLELDEDKDRIESTKMLVTAMREAGINVNMLDSNYNEMIGLIQEGGRLTTASFYDNDKAFPIARCIKAKRFGEKEFYDFFASIDGRLKKMGIRTVKTYYDPKEHEFQLDEIKLNKMIEERYKKYGDFSPLEKAQTIQTDIRSIVMVDRLRHGYYSQNIHDTRHILVTRNNVIANVCKEFESNRGKTKHIPACITEDMFGAILWMYQPSKLLEFNRKQLLSDCYSILKPSRNEMKRFREKINKERQENSISEEQYLLLISSPAVYETLMDTTKGDYASIENLKADDFYDKLVEKMNSDLNEEKDAHLKTTDDLEKVIGELNKTSVELKQAADEISKLKLEKEEEKEKKYRIWGWIAYILCIVFPGMIITAALEIVKSYYSSFKSVAFLMQIAIAFILLIGGLCVKKLRKYVFGLVRKLMIKSRK